MIFLLPAKIATISVAAYTVVAEGVAVLSVVEIGPNLLAAVTSVVGALVLITQLRLAHYVSKNHARIERVEEKVEEKES